MIVLLFDNNFDYNFMFHQLVLMTRNINIWWVVVLLVDLQLTKLHAFNQIVQSNYNHDRHITPVLYIGDILQDYRTVPGMDCINKSQNEPKI